MKLLCPVFLFAIIAFAYSCSKSGNSGGGTPTPTTASITALNCPAVIFDATATAGVAYSGTATVPYTGGNGVAFAAG
jgi:hypothetical protein